MQLAANPSLEEVEPAVDKRLFASVKPWQWGGKPQKIRSLLDHGQQASFLSFMPGCSTHFQGTKQRRTCCLRGCTGWDKRPACF